MDNYGDSGAEKLHVRRSFRTDEFVATAIVIDVDLYGEKEVFVFQDLTGSERTDEYEGYIKAITTTIQQSSPLNSIEERAGKPLSVFLLNQGAIPAMEDKRRKTDILWSCFLSGSLEIAFSFIDPASGLANPVDESWLFWHEMLSGPLPVFNLPSDYPRSNSLKKHFKQSTFTLEKSQKQRINRYIQEYGLDLHSFLFSSFGLLVARYTSLNDVMIATNLDGISDTVKMGFIPVPVRTRFNEGDCFSSLNRSVLSEMNVASQHQGCNLSLLREKFADRQGEGCNSLFDKLFVLSDDVIFDFDGMLDDDVSADLSAFDIANKLAPTKALKTIDLTLSMLDKETHIEAAFIYESDLFSEQRMLRMVGHFKQLINSVLADPAGPMGKLQILTGAERKQLLTQWSVSQSYKQQLCIHQLFELCTRSHPERIAVSFEYQQVSYGKLNELANVVTYAMQVRGINSGSIVGIYIDRSLETIISILAVLKAGAAYVPIDQSFPRERVDFILSDSQADIVLTKVHLVGGLPTGVNTLLFEQINFDQPHEIAEVKTSNSDLAYIIYTSGSTGKPKGVKVSHKAVVHLFAATRDQFKFDGNDVWTVFHSIAFDLSVWEIWGGAC